MRWARASASAPATSRFGKDRSGLTRLVGAFLLLLTAFTLVVSAGPETPAGATSPSPWSILSSPNRTAGADNALAGISCASATACTAVGYWDNAGHNENLIEQWDGAAWSIVPSPETGLVGNVLYSVSCISASFCMAVGEQHPGPYQTFVEEWDGAAWSIVPSPDTSATQDNQLWGVSCTSPTACTAVGYANNGTVYQTLIEEWDGTAWSIVPSPDTNASQYNFFRGVSCTSATACTAVGAASNGTKYQTLIEQWDGTAWSIVPSPDTSASQSNHLYGVSCLSSTACTAVGGASNGTAYQTLIEVWDGTAWSIVPSPDTSASQYNFLYSVSCVSATACNAVGTSSNGTNYQTLVQAWDGTAWTLVPSPDTSAAQDNQLWGISCTSSSVCTAAGYITPNVWQTLIETLPNPVSVTLSASSPTVDAIQTVPESALPVNSVETGASSDSAGNEASAPLRSIPLRSIALGALPLRSVPLRSVPLRSVPAAAAALADILLSDLPIDYPVGCADTSCTGWSGVLAGTSLANEPLQTVSLAQVLADPTASARFESVPLSGLDVSSTPLASLPLASIALAGTPLRSVPLPGAGASATSRLQAWCDQLARLSFNCQSDFGIDPNSPSTADNVDLLTLSLAGVPLSSIPLRSVPLTSIDLTSSPLRSIPLRSVNIDSTPLRSVPLRSVPLRSVPLGSIPLRSVGNLPAVVDCTLVDCSSTSTATLGDAEAADAISAAATLQSLENLDPSVLASVPLRSIDLTSSPLRSIPLRSVDLTSSPLRSIPLRSIDLTSAGAQSIPLRSVPLRSISNPSSVVDCTLVDCSSTSTATLGDAADAGAIRALATIADLENLDPVPLRSIPLRSVATASSPLRSIPLRSVGDLDSVVDCSLVDCSATSTQTLGDAANANAILSTATLDQLGDFLGTTVGDISGGFGSTSPTLADLGAFLGTSVGDLFANLNPDTPGFPSITLSDLLAGIAPPTSYPWQSVDLTNLPLGQSESAGGTETFTATMTVLGTTPTPMSVSLALPPGFTYVAGSATLDGSPTADPNPTSSPLTFTPTLGVGTHDLSVQARSGLDLGPAVASVTATSGSVSSNASTSVNVLDGDQPDGTPADATPIDTASLNLGHISAPGAVGYWQIPVSQGDELALSLSNLPADYDLALYSPSGSSLQGSPVQELPGVTDAPPSLTAVSQPAPGATELNQDAPSGFQTYAVSDNRGTQDETIQTQPLDAGTYLVEVTGYNGASSPAPYLLRATLLPTGQATSCPPIEYPNPTPAPGTSDAVPDNANTLFLVDTQRLSAAYGAAAEQQVWNALGSLAGDAGDGVVGARIAVDANPQVESAYSNWNDGPGADPCNVTAANSVEAAIGKEVDQLRQTNPSITNVVIVGADDQIPFARLADGATVSNERDYASSSFPGESNVLADTLAQGYYLSDDPLTATKPLGVGSATLYTPQLAVGRLVETPSEIIGAVTRFMSSHGVLDASSALSTGYSFLTSGAQLAASNLAKVSGRTVAQLINENWSKSDLENALNASPVPSIISLNAHFDYSRALPASGDATGDQSDLFTTTDVRAAPANSYAGSLLFSMGCHAGLDVNDDEVGASGVSTPVDDWAKTFADEGALWVGNTGYGYGDTDSVAYSAHLMADFANNLDGSMSVGAALTNAKESYAAGSAILSPYDLKALMESTFYGLPMYTLNSTPPAPPPPPTPLPTQIDPLTGLTSAPVSVSLPTGSGQGQLGEESGANGSSYYQVNGPTGGQTQTTEFRPIEPLTSVDVTQPGGLTAHGALITELGSTDVPSFTATVAQPDAGSAATMPVAAAGAFPNQLQRVATYQTLGANGTTTSQELDLVAGQFLPGTSSGQGTQRLFNSISASVLYTPAADTNFAPPSINANSASVTGSSTTFTANVSDAVGSVKRVLVLYTDAESPGTWTPLDLASTDGTNWSGIGASSASGKVAYVVQAVDSDGNVGVASNKGLDFPAGPTTSSLSPSEGPAAGGTSVTIDGTNLSSASSVTFGGRPGTVTADSATSISVTAPPGSAGPVDVGVTTPGGTTTDSAAFSYVPSDCRPPSVTSSNSATAVAGSAFVFTVTTCSSAVPVIKASGLPRGLGLVDDHNGSATISGTPSSSDKGPYTANISAKVKGQPTGTQRITITVENAPVFKSKSKIRVAAGSAFTFLITTKQAYPEPTISTSSTLPGGIALTDLGNGTARLGGTSNNGAQGTYVIVVTATNDVGAPVNQSITLTLY